MPLAGRHARCVGGFDSLRAASPDLVSPGVKRRDESTGLNRDNK